jgi:hypothetical protein
MNMKYQQETLGNLASKFTTLTPSNTTTYNVPGGTVTEGNLFLKGIELIGTGSIVLYDREGNTVIVESKRNEDNSRE